MMKRGCGIVCIHYATGLKKEDVSSTGEHPLLGWMGGYFANPGSTHHVSYARVFDEARITPTKTSHPVLRGWKEFVVRDEPYGNNYFGPSDNKPAPNVTILATSQQPPEKPQREAVAWCVQRADDGRGFGIVMPHFYKNWSNEDLRRFVLNGIVWTAGVEVPADGATLGEITVRGNVVMAGYYNDPDATAAAIRNGWFHSGDAAVVHPDGYVEIRDRFKDVIISGGENISSVELEGCLLTHPAVQETAVVGMPHEKWGESPHAFVVLKSGASASEDELKEHVRAQLAHFKTPQAVSFVDELPKTATGKVQKYVLRQHQPGIATQ